MVAACAGRILLAAALLGARAPAVRAEPAARRVAVVVGHNVGQPGDVTLRYAERDAQRVARLLRELGGVAGEDLVLLLGPTADRVRTAFTWARATLHGSGPGAMLLFFYSGHADPRGLKLGPSRLAWAEVEAFLDREVGTAGEVDESLRVAMIDACHAGALTRTKGFQLGPPLVAEHVPNGLAMLVSAGSAEAAQETVQLGGSFFSHYLIAGLRGAADVDNDGRVTLDEAHAFASRRTRQATAQWAPSQQHPAYRFDLRGSQQVVLTDLRRAEATLLLDEPLAGQLIVTERGSSLVLFDLDKATGTQVRLALPAGRYVVHLRRDMAVWLAEVELPWGGRVKLAPSDLVAQSYMSVARKGSVVEVHRHRLSIAALAGSGTVSGMGLVTGVPLAYGYRWAPWELELRLLASQARFAARDTRVETRMVGMGAAFAYERPWGVVDLRIWGAVEGQVWRQTLRQAAMRQAVVPAAGLGAGVRLPVSGRLFAHASVEGLLHWPRVEDKGTAARLAVRAGLGVGLAL